MANQVVQTLDVEVIGDEEVVKRWGRRFVVEGFGADDW